MIKSYHICLSAGDEIMFRSQEDYDRGFNYFALALAHTDSIGLVESFMSNHIHLMVQTSSHRELMNIMRMSYSKYFNSKYNRCGRLGDVKHFYTEITGLHHHLAAMSYVLRNGVHHGIVSIPYAYQNSSVNAIFMKEMGKVNRDATIPHNRFYKYVGRRLSVPSHYKMSERGVFLRESVLDITQVENMFGSPRAFNYYMSRRNHEEWEKEQENDKNGIKAVCLSDIEGHSKLHSVDTMREIELRRFVTGTSDIELCKEVDELTQNRYGRKSIYLLSSSEKRAIAEFLYKQRHIPESQIKRCLVL